MFSDSVSFSPPLLSLKGPNLLFTQVFWGLETVAGRLQKKFLKNNTWKSRGDDLGPPAPPRQCSLVDQLEVELRRPSTQEHRLMGTWVEGLPEHWGDSSEDRLHTWLFRAD